MCLSRAINSVFVFRNAIDGKYTINILKKQEKGEKKETVGYAA
jgi:hypothetical protein